jgi:hypothetical protein
MTLPNIGKEFTFRKFIFQENNFSKENYFSTNKRSLWSLIAAVEKSEKRRRKCDGE